MTDDSTTTSPLRPLAGEGPRRRRLSVVHGPGPRRSVWIERSRVVVGRDERAADLWVEDREVSRRHAVFERVPEFDAIRVSNLSEKNGTLVFGRPIEAPTFLQDGAVVRVGASLLVLEDVAASPSDDECPADRSLAMAAAIRRAMAAAPARLSIVLEGPTGAGKEVLAKEIHDRSGRRGRFVAVNCATLDRGLLGSELFGHVRGAFSDAHADREGLFRAAEGGTLFLDEIGDLPGDQQAALLRALETRSVRPVGSDRELPVDVRVLAATHRNLAELEAKGGFREDLAARLAELSVRVPGLAARRVELFPLLEIFAGPRTIDPVAAEALLVYDWPKNVRELKHVAREIALFNPGRPIALDDLPDGVKESVRRKLAGGEPAESRPSRERLAELLAAHGGNVAKVARELGAHRPRVYRWIAAYGIDPERFRDRGAPAGDA